MASRGLLLYGVCEGLLELQAAQKLLGYAQWRYSGGWQRAVRTFERKARFEEAVGIAEIAGNAEDAGDAVVAEIAEDVVVAEVAGDDEDAAVAEETEDADGAEARDVENPEGAVIVRGSQDTRGAESHS